MGGIRMARLRPFFNAVADTDYGPTTDRKIRYSIADYKTMLGLFLREYITGAGPWAGPISATFSLWEDATHTGGNQHTDTFPTNPPYNGYNLQGGGTISAATGNTFNIPDFHDPLNPVEGGACPLLDPEDPEGAREDADLTEFATGFGSAGLSLFRPAIPQSGWDTATHVWLAFDIIMGAGIVFAYVCNPSTEVNGNIAGTSISTNFLGIDYSGGGGGFSPTPTGSIALGDGTTEAFFWSPTGQDHFDLDSLDTTNF